MFFFHYFTYFLNIINHSLGLYSIQDVIEVFFFITITYKSMLWLRQDHTKQLLLNIYGYFALLSFSYLCSCPILFSTLLICSPLYLFFIMIIHQKQIQKNFILSQKEPFLSKIIPDKNWLENLIQACLISSHQNKSIVCIIERTQHLDPLLQISFKAQIPIQGDIVSFLLASTKISDHSLMWIHESGFIQSLNLEWSSLLLNELILPPTDQSILLHELALLLTKKTDAFIFSISASQKNKYFIWHQGTFFQETTIQSLLSKIKIIMTTQSIYLKKGIIHAQGNTSQN
ncbi:hypothetical protein HYV11_00185 [Candidatus Dependentiae bacterium]|nr:hypothetical protein [Candidatus Dependentiae bacterium]